MSSNAAPLLHEIAALLDRLAQTGEGGSVQLNGLPLQPGDYEALQEALGEGEVSAEIQALGPDPDQGNGTAWRVVGDPPQWRRGSRGGIDRGDALPVPPANPGRGCGRGRTSPARAPECRNKRRAR